MGCCGDIQGGPSRRWIRDALSNKNTFTQFLVSLFFVSVKSSPGSDRPLFRPHNPSIANNDEPLPSFFILFIFVSFALFAYFLVFA